MGPSKNMLLSVVATILASGILSSSSQQRALYFAMATQHVSSSEEHIINTPYHDAPSSLRRRGSRRGRLQLHTMNKNTHEQPPISNSEERRTLHAVGVIHDHHDDEQSTNNVDETDERWDNYQPFTSTSDVTDFLTSTAIKLSSSEQLDTTSSATRSDNNTTDTSLFDTNQINSEQKPKSQFLPTISPSPTSPTTSPAPTPPITPAIIIHDGPHFYDEDIYNYDYDNDDPPSGHGYYGSRDENGNYIREETDFKEFIAFVGWYAFLIICCLLPTFCAYYRRRRNARALRENLTNIQGRLAEIERRRNENDDTMLELEGENRDRDWEYLESLFGSNGTATNAERSEEESRRRIMADIMGSVGIRVLDLMERDVRRRKEKGRKMVGALKQTSLLVKECHLVDKTNKKGGASSDVIGGLNDINIEGDIELGNMNCNINNADMNNKPTTIGLERERNEDGKEIQIESEHIDSTSNTNDVPTTATADLNKQSTTENSDKADYSDVDTMPTPSAPPLTTNSDKTNNNNNSQQAIITSTVEEDTTAAPQSVDAAVPATTPSSPQDNPISSLYQVDNPYDDDDEGNTVLCIPCTNNISDESKTITMTPRCVPATCIICLLQYEPGTYVTWSSNKECTHAFHRDCILMWLLKKEEPYLCPCCRREFVLESMLNDNDENDIDEEERGGTDSGGGGVIVLEHNFREPVQQTDNMPSADTTVAPAWNSLSNAARPL